MRVAWLGQPVATRLRTALLVALCLVVLGGCVQTVPPSTPTPPASPLWSEADTLGGIEWRP
jgi:hypothetical protein